jgi:hypothetical protein
MEIAPAFFAAIGAEKSTGARPSIDHVVIKLADLNLTSHFLDWIAGAPSSHGCERSANSEVRNGSPTRLVVHTGQSSQFPTSNLASQLGNLTASGSFSGNL